MSNLNKSTMKIKKKKEKSIVWERFEKIIDANDNKTSKCKCNYFDSDFYYDPKKMEPLHLKIT